MEAMDLRRTIFVEFIHKIQRCLRIVMNEIRFVAPAMNGIINKIFFPPCLLHFRSPLHIHFSPIFLPQTFTFPIPQMNLSHSRETLLISWFTPTRRHNFNYREEVELLVATPFISNYE